MGDVLAALGDAAGVSRVHVFENVEGPDGGTRTELRYEWTAPGVVSGLEHPELTIASYADHPRWQRELEAGNALAGDVRDFPESERPGLERLGIRSVVAVPISVAGRWHGFLGFDQCDGEREWSPAEIAGLRAAAGIVGAAFERRRSEEARAETEERYRRLVELSPDAIAVHQKGVIVFANPAAVRLLGARHAEDLVGCSVLQFIHETSRPMVLTRLQRLREGKEVPKTEEVFVRLDGTAVDVEVAATPMVLRGEPAVQVVIRDISQRKRAEQALLRQNAYLEALHQTTLSLIHRLDPQDVLEAIVTRAGQLLESDNGYVYLVVPGTQELEVRVARGAFVSYMGFRLRRGEGAAGRVWATGQPLVIDEYGTFEGRSPAFPSDSFHAIVAVPLTSAGEVVGVLGVAHLEPDRHFSDEDLTIMDRFAELASIALDNARLYAAARQEVAERRRAEETLRFQAFLLDSVENAVVATDGEDVITYWNAFAEELLGHAPADVIGKSFRDVLDISLDVVDGVNRAVEAGETWSGDFEVRRADGSLFIAFGRVSPIRGADGRSDGMIGVLLDVTERRRAEEALRAAFEREKEVSQRLLAVDEMKNTFLEAVSHELRTPLSAILGLALTLERHEVDLPPERSAELMQRLAFNARKLDRLLSDLLDLDRLSRGIVRPRLRDTNLAELVEQVVATSEVAGNRTVEVLAEPVKVPVEPAKIERIVENLVANAVRHTADDCPIWVTVREVEDGALISVEDAGPGVPDELREAIFEPFRQGGSSRPHSPGVGIGLSLVTKFAELHGGRAWVEDREGGGAAFRVFLPSEPAEQPVP
jgi:two-component system, cell cycle sensor histidine kinase and response regulator CckA